MLKSIYKILVFIKTFSFFRNKNKHTNITKNYMEDHRCINNFQNGFYIYFSTDYGDVSDFYISEFKKEKRLIQYINNNSFEIFLDRIFFHLGLFFYKNMKTTKQHNNITNNIKIFIDKIQCSCLDVEENLI